ncbi:hypothetical protein [Poseidonibacter ostreae]|uniref:Uncharacterized protein n=1 Tax=Poseidonibacter ostreae TaxID=2654171 RepID=A0A6L4WTK2_9BACT|nr:hypothetical protein [Poseidonibacter ostreae]KAB7885931.1 hypothetical protein GA417_07005 [Poseidonibacter ostreae]KAB7889408.1 hypothetical protein GBG19_06385 [Poseidonibacter ostreae]KAB7891684.1 hypothetical protein GBG18_06290 [Poseidonibacter ostreae]MAC83353.1 hypothetical protein [Arcobacter sp.]
MNIYIYGNNSFKKEIHETLEHANIKFKLDSDSKIENITSLDLLKSTIEANPNDIYLIDDEKIIKKNAITQKIKFLIPKDGIEEEFLLDNGIADVSLDSLKDIPKYILKRHEQQKEIEPNIQNSIINIVDEAYENDEDDFDIELDDELSELLSSAKKEDKIDDESSHVNLDELENLLNEDELEHKEISKDKFADMINFDEDVGLNNVKSDYDDEFIKKENVEELEEENKSDINEIENIILQEPIQGDDMSSNFSELDSLDEQDVLSALQNIDSPVIEASNSTTNEKVELASSNVQDIAELISKLLNNKTLEITIKIKD